MNIPLTFDNADEAAQLAHDRWNAYFYDHSDLRREYDAAVETDTVSDELRDQYAKYCAKEALLRKAVDRLSGPEPVSDLYFLLAQSDAHEAAHADLVAEFDAAFQHDLHCVDPEAPQVMTADLSVRFSRYLAERRLISRALRVAVTARADGVVRPDPLESARTDTALTRDLVRAVESIGYKIDADSRWTTHFTRLGVLRVSFDDHPLRDITWDIGSGRDPSRTYRKGSRHHQAVLEALRFIRDRSPFVFAGY